MIKSLFGYIKEHKWLYLSIALVLLLYDFTMLIPTQVIQRLVDHLFDNRFIYESFSLLDMYCFLGCL